MRLLLLFALCLGCSHAPPPASAPASRTTWVFEPNLAYDSLCFLNLLSGDPWYLGFGFADEVAPWIAKLPPDARDAIARIKTTLKAKDHLMSAYLALVMSVADPRTLADLRRITDDDAAWAALRAGFLATEYGKEDGFAVMDEIRKDLAIALRQLEADGFPAYWERHALPAVTAAIAKQATAAKQYDVIGADEAILGRRLPTDKMTVEILAYVRPHGVRITGWRFLSDERAPLAVTVKTAMHELLHPPFPRVGEIDAVLRRIEADPFFVRLVKEHNPSFGYTTTDGLLEEDLVTAVDTYNAHEMGLLPDLADYFAKHDDGIHVVAFLVRALIEREHRAGESYPDFLVRMEREAKLRPGALEAQFRAAPGTYAVKALTERGEVRPGG